MSDYNEIHVLEELTTRYAPQVAEQLADVMFALSAPSRLQILGCLLEAPHSVGEITSALGMEQSAVSHQLRVLRDHTLVKVRREGKRRVYALYDDHLKVLLDEALRHVERRGERSAADTVHFGIA